MFISMVLTYSYNMGARHRLWMQFWPPFSTTCKHSAKTCVVVELNDLSGYFIVLY